MVSVFVASNSCDSESQERRVIVDRDSLKVVATAAFPKDLTCEIHVGPAKNPNFFVEGGNGRIEAARIELGSDRPTVSFVRKLTKEPSYVLLLFLDQPDRPVVGLFDLNIDGVWDIKKRPPKQFIRRGSEWLEVDKIDGITSEKTTAVKGKTRFVFEKDKWIALPEAAR
jgi:hypothetical protein